ncbi:leucyl aminopeptidase family protein [Brevundimonas sp. VNH65]|uniref:leucyl aminopeptidase family protein n=1 Tax=Brevundimonas sp. VNH65 TaxID=3400917 RepID=UPI003C01C623
MFFARRRLAVAASVLALAAGMPAVAIAQPAAPGVAAAPTQRAVAFAVQPGAAEGTLILPLRSEADLDALTGLAEIDAVRRALGSAAFRYGARQSLSLRGIGAWDRILILGLGSEAGPADVQWSGAVAGRAVMSDKGPATVMAPALSAEQAAGLATGMGIGHYRSNLHQASARSAEAPGGLTIVTPQAQAAEAAYRARGAGLVEAMTWTRDISNEPANIVYPEVFVERARAAFRDLPGVTIEVLDVPAMQRLGMGVLLGAGRGSARPPRLLVVRYQGRGAPDGGPIALVGKGITFDTGGISIKPGAGMGNMKMDMSGAASVVGATLALAKSGAPVNVVAVAALVENMPDGGAIRPSDVLTAMNGKTVEIISTDAEGRLVLSDALVWTERNLNPAAVVDVATLTGAVGGALGDDYAGLFSRHDALADQLTAASAATGEGLWRLPLHPSYAQDTSSTIADIKNSGAGGAGAGSGAWFIGEFLSRDIPWAHLDIANMAYGGPNDWKPDGSAGFSVRLLEQFVRDWTPIEKGAADGGR